jgi:hypothetical protein
MKLINKILIWVVPVLTGITFSERLISYFVLKQIPEDLIQRVHFSAIRFSFDIILLFKLFPFIVLSLVIFLLSKRFNNRYIWFAMTGGLAGILIPYTNFISQLSEYWITSPSLSSTSGLAYLVIPILVLPPGFAGVFAVLSIVLLYGYYKKSDTVQFYKTNKKKRTFLAEGIVYFIIAVIIATGFIVWALPHRFEQKVSSVRTSGKKLERYFSEAEKESDFDLFVLLANNQALPPHLLEKIYNSGSALFLSGDKKYLKIFNSLALNSKTPQHILFEISKLNIVSINSNLALNHNTPGEILLSLTTDYPGARKISIARNPNTPAEALAILSREQNYVVRRLVAGHKNATEEILMNLINDNDERVRSVAIREIQRFQK